ncbi:MAG: 2,3-bisphosphoglycerate-independent phosphoglycerate mutase [Clostridia bacterium]|nr:2,3-bisphosphoglycerate-independent phosphoglycerate mutase [Clostridia bacterium]
MQQINKPLVLMILDGWGQAPPSPDNAVTAARTPNLDAAFRRWSSALLRCSGLDVGLPDGQIGNSEVGHTNIGAGRVVYQDLPRISKAVADGDFFQNPALLGAVSHAKAGGGAVHLMGLLSDGGVHSTTEHLFALLRLCEDHGVRTFVHCFMDGRDTAPKSGAGYMRELTEHIAAHGLHARIASVSGRFYAMDRDKRWERLEKAYAALAAGDAPFCADPVQVLEQSYAEDVTDEFVVPHICLRGAEITARDSVIFYNFRPDRARELTRAFVDEEFDGFPRPQGAIKPHYVCMTQYDASMPNVQVAFKPQTLHNIFGEYIAAQGLRQLRIAETEKYAHVTFFFNGGREEPFSGEERILVPSPKVATYDLQPEMSAYEVADKCVHAIEHGGFDVIILNFANCDMVGHTGVFDAAVRAVEAVDTCVGRLLDAIERVGGAAIITADHGNAEHMFDESGPFTAHTTNPVPVIMCRDGVRVRDGALCDLAPTMLELLGLDKPTDMTGESLIIK